MLPPRPHFDRQAVIQVTAYVITALVALLLASEVLRLREIDPAVPLEYAGDALFLAAETKRLHDQGLAALNPTLGAPGVQDLRTFPRGELLHSVLKWTLSRFSPSFGTTLNGYFVLSFPLIALTMHATLRHLGVGILMSSLGGQLFSFLPGHLERGLVHLTYAVYFMVPLSLICLVAVTRTASDAGDRPPAPMWACAIICALVAIAQPYHALFLCYMLIIAGGVATVRRREKRPMILAATLAGVTMATLLLSLAPSFSGQRAEVASPALGLREPFEAEVYGLRLTQLLLPVTSHRWAPLRELRAEYNYNVQVIRSLSEGDYSSLGMIGSVGLLLLLILILGVDWLQWLDCDRQKYELIWTLARLNLAALLLATIGGFGSLVALLVSPQVRGYNRMSVFIALFGITTVVIILDSVGRLLGPGLVRRSAWALGAIALTALGLLDQTPRGRILDHAHRAAAVHAYRSDADIVSRIEASVAPDSMILQLPYNRFPEGGPVHGMLHYEHLRPYLHSSTLRWSFGAVRGHVEDMWLWYVAGLAPAQLIDHAARQGFCGVWLDRSGYADNGAAMTTALAALLPDPPLSSVDGRRLFYRLPVTAEPPHVLPVFVADWTGRCYWLEGTPESNARWCGRSGSVAIVNLASEPRSIELSMSFVADANRIGRLVIDGELLEADLALGAQPSRLTRKLEIDPGVHRVFIQTDVPRLLVAHETRDLRVWVEEFRITPVVSGKDPAPLDFLDNVQKR